jgi:ParB family chromosome partitioning protein
MNDSVYQDSSVRKPLSEDSVFLSPASAQVRENHPGSQENIVAYQGIAGRIESIDADFMCPSPHANRSELEYKTPEFLALKETIKSTGGNVQAVQVRPLFPGEAPHHNFPQAQYVIVYGHRRHRACLQLNLPVVAHVLDVCDEHEFFQKMLHENSERKSLSPFEAGLFYERVMKSEGIIEQKKLAELLKISVSGVCESLKVSRLPEEILQLFDSPLNLSIRDGRVLAREWLANAELMHERIPAIKELKKKKKLKKVELIQLLLGKRSPNTESIRQSNSDEIEVVIDDEVVATVKTTSEGVTTIKIMKKQLDDNDRLWIVEQLQTLFENAPFLQSSIAIDLTDNEVSV